MRAQVTSTELEMGNISIISSYCDTEGHDNQYRKHSQLSKYREGNNIVNIIAIANFYLGQFCEQVHVIKHLP